MATTYLKEVPYHNPDAIFALTAQYNQDSSTHKVNLGQGTYRDGNGDPWVLPSVRKARQQLSQDLVHEYLPIAGHADFRNAAARILLGEELWRSKQGSVRQL